MLNLRELDLMQPHRCKQRKLKVIYELSSEGIQISKYRSHKQNNQTFGDYVYLSWTVRFAEKKHKHKRHIKKSNNPIFTLPLDVS